MNYFNFIEVIISFRMSTVYRHKFSELIIQEIVAFTNTHRYDDPETFKECWDEWVKDNQEIISREENRLKSNGYIGDVLLKMYKSARYYYKNKSLEKNEPKKRKKYISLDKNLIKIIDTFIKDEGFKSKPSQSYDNFINNDKYKERLEIEKNRLLKERVDEEEFYKKIKKTYKNRYFINQKQ